MSDNSTELVVELPRGRARAVVKEPELHELHLAKELYITFYNMSGMEPINAEFEPAAEWPDEERVRSFGMEPLAKLRAEAYRRAITAAAGTGVTVNGRLATGRLIPRRGDGRVLDANVQMERRGWVTHFAIGTHDRIILAGQFDAPTPVLPGNGFSFGIDLDSLRRALKGTPARPALPSPEEE